MSKNHKHPLSAFTLALALLLALVLASCGDDDSAEGTVSGDSDPQEVLDTTLGSDQQIDSGVLDLSFELTSTGADAGTVSASLAGPFQAGADENSLPELDLTASATLDAADQGFDFEGGLTLTEDGAFVNYGGEDYEVDEQTFSFVQAAYEESSAAQTEDESAGSFEQFGIDPASWVTDLTNEGTEDLDGDEVVHISGAGDVGAIVEDLQTIAEQAPAAATQVDPAQLSQLEELVQSATIDVYANAEDDTLRQLDLNMDLSDPGTEDAASLSLSIGIADPNTEQEITAPEDPLPFADLLEQVPGGAGALGGLGSLGASSDPSTAPPAGISEDYYDCVAGAQSQADLEACGAP